MIDDEQKIEVAKNFVKLHPAAFAMWEQGRVKKQRYKSALNDDFRAKVLFG